MLWRWRARAKEQSRLRKFEISVEKYGAGHGVVNPQPRSSIEKPVDSPRSFFDTEEEERRPRKSLVNFRLSTKAPPRASIAPRSPTSVHQWFIQSTPSEPLPEGMRETVCSIASKPAAPLRVVNGAPEPWTPATTPSIRAASTRFTRQIEEPQVPPAAAFPPKLTLTVPSPMPPARRSSLIRPATHGEPSSSTSGPSNSPSSPPISASTSKPRKLPTPPHPPPTTFNYASKYDQEQASRPGSADSQRSHTTSLPRLMTAITRFVPTLNDELALQVGDTVRVIDEYKDGWILVQHAGGMDSPRGVVPAVCLQERKRIIPPPGSATIFHKRSDGSLSAFSTKR